MRPALSSAASVFLLIVTALPSAAAPDSVYTSIDTQNGCTVTAQAAEDEGGDWAEFVCPGYRDYPVHVSYGDLRESLFYGFPPDGKPDSWESFGGFNSVSGTIEWRIEGGRPFATIHRWTVSTGDSESSVQVLVVEKVGQPGRHEGCVVGYVVATGNPDHNQKARDLADAHARDFACWRDEPLVQAGSVALPGASRHRREPE